jgi:very-short-patch-repair endonuclease
MADAVADLAWRQHGIVARRQLLELGMGSSTVDGWRQSGHLHCLHPGVYAVGHRRLTREARWMAAVLACPHGSALGFGSAGQSRGIVSSHQRLALHVIVPRGAGADPDGIVVHRVRNLDPRDVGLHRGIPTTTATRTVWDLATMLSPLATMRAFEQAEKLRVLDRPRLAALREAAPSRRGAGVIAELLRERALPLAETRSLLEEIVLETCRDRGLPLPAVNVPLLGFEVDFLWERERVVVEADGGDHLTPRQRDRDNERDAALGRAGYLVRRYGGAAGGERSALAAELKAILAERGG